MQPDINSDSIDRVTELNCQAELAGLFTMCTATYGMSPLLWLRNMSLGLSEVSHKAKLWPTCHKCQEQTRCNPAFALLPSQTTCKMALKKYHGPHMFTPAEAC